MATFEETHAEHLTAQAKFLNRAAENRILGVDENERRAADRVRRTAQVVAELKAKQEAPEPDTRALMKPTGELYPTGRYVGEQKAAERPERKRSYEETQAELARTVPPPLPVERRDTVRKGYSFAGSRGRMRESPRRGAREGHAEGLETLLERVRPEAAPRAGGGGTGKLVVYGESGPFGRRFYRVKFEGRTFAPTFDTVEQAKAFALDLKARAEPEYAAKRERMVEADRRFFTESTLAHRQHPLFVKVVDTTRPPPARLTS